MRCSLVLFSLLSIATSFASAGETQIVQVDGCPMPYSKHQAVRAVVSIPPGYWLVTSAVEADSGKPIHDAYVLAPANFKPIAEGRRMRAALINKHINAGRGTVSSTYWPSLQYARENSGTGPTVGQINRNQYVLRQLQDGPYAWRDVNGERPDGPFGKLLQVKFDLEDGEPNQRRVLPQNRKPLAVELRPYIDDGKHWIQYTDGSAERVEVDPKLLAKHRLKIRPVYPESVTEETKLESLEYRIILGTAVRGSIEVSLLDVVSRDTLTFSFDSTGLEENSTALEDLRTARHKVWKTYAKTGSNSILKSWMDDPSGDAPNNRRTGQTTNAFAILGGRAAIEETLQLQNLVATSGEEKRSIDIDTIEGVTVKAHPYKEMLGNAEGGSLELANFARHDRFFVYVAKPKSLLPMLDYGGDFLSTISASFSKNNLDYGLHKRYLDRLGMNRRLIESAIKSGLVEEFAVTTPDLFFVDGTDLTIVAKLKQPKLFAQLLSTLNIRGLGDGAVAEIETKQGTSYWSLRDNLLCISSQRGELDSVLKLVESDGKGSLGRSTEFRYMLTKLGVIKETRAFAYFSDPFVRRLVGPQVKISQLRRLKSRAQMEYLAAKQLQAKLDGVDDISNADAFAHYAPRLNSKDFEIDDNGVVSSIPYGRIDRLKSLQEVPVDLITEQERQAYQLYRQNYDRYWRQFFDPIAIRLSEAENNTLQLETFILPLIDSSIYNDLRDAFHSEKDGRPLSLPKLEPQPIMQLSANLKEEAWEQVVGNFSSFFEEYSGVSSALLDDLGPGAHLAVFDADPVIALGSGDLMGAMGTNNAMFGRGANMLMIPVALSVLTRPCTIMVETQDPERTAQYLRQSARVGKQGDRQFAATFYQQGDGDSWVWSMNILGVVNLRFGIEVQDNYLIIRNIPWSAQDKVVGVETSQLDSADLSLLPGACDLQLPGLFASAADQERRSSMRGLSRLYPLVVSGAASVDSAGETHKRLFGFSPLHPRGGAWTWSDNQLQSSIYGSAFNQRQPAYDPEKPFGIMHAIESINLSMQFEDDGLRSRIRWKMKK